jgi:hypothetical protein
LTAGRLGPIDPSETRTTSRDVYLNCSRCGLSLHTSRFPHIKPENCPRCLARAHVLHPLFRSPMTTRELSARNDPTQPSPTPAEEAPHDQDTAA